MRSKRIVRTRYYCGFCEATGRLKGFWTKPKAERHERGCTANPERICGLCEEIAETIGGKSEQKPIGELVAALSDVKPIYGMDDLRKVANNCPACILAAIRQSPLRKDMEKEEFWKWMSGLNFDFRSELENFWKVQNETKYQAEVLY